MTPEIAELLRTGKLHPFDADWIGRLNPEQQMTAAKKCMGPNFTTVSGHAKSNLARPSIRSKK